MVALFPDCETSASVAVAPVRRVVRRKRRKRRHSLESIFPPMPRPSGGPLLPDEKAYVEQHSHWRLAQDFVNKYGWKYSYLDPTEQVEILESKLVSLMAGRFDCTKARLSTLCYSTAFPRELQRANELAQRKVFHAMPETFDAPDESHTIPIEVQDAVEALEKLDARQREAVSMLFGLGAWRNHPCKPVEIKVLLGMPSSAAVNGMIRKALVVLREQLGGEL